MLAWDDRLPPDGPRGQGPMTRFSNFAQSCLFNWWSCAFHISCTDWYRGV